MSLVKKKEIQIFSDGSVRVRNSSFNKLKKIKIYKKDHLTFSFNKKDSTDSVNLKDFEKFKNKYFKFKD